VQKQKEVRMLPMLTYSDRIFLAQKANSTHNTSYNLRQVLSDQENSNLEKKVTEYFHNYPERLKSLENSVEDHVGFFKKQKKYKQRRWSGHSYGINLILHTAYLFQDYHFSYGVEGKPTYASKETLSKELGICIRTLDKALKILRDMGVIYWKSGKKTWETNTYYLADVYKSTPMRKPQGFKHPKHLWLKQQYLIKKQKLKEFTRTLFEHLLGDIADYLLRKNKKIRTSFEKRVENDFKSSKDPPKSTKLPPNWHLLKDLNLNFKDQWILSRYSEHLLRAAIDDLRFYQSLDKKVNNIAAFLMSRCQEHDRQVKPQKNTNNIKKWLSSYFKSRRTRFLFISESQQLDRTKNESRPIIHLLWHKQEIQKSILRVYQKIQGAWIDKVFNFDRPNLTEAIESYLEDSLRNTTSVS
jgi:hypothetical protein